MNNHKGLKMWILIGFCFAAQLSMASDYNPPMKATDGATISNLTILDFVENGENVKVGQNFYSTRSGQTVKVYVKWAQYVYTYKTLLSEAKTMNPKRYGKYASLSDFIADWVEISGEKAGSEKRFKNTGVYIVTGAIDPLPSFTTWNTLPTNTSYWGITDTDGYDIWAKGNCANVILTYMEYIAPVADAVEAPAPVVATRRALGSNEKITCLGDTVVMGTRTSNGTYAKGNSLWLKDDGTWYQLNGSKPKTELCPKTGSITDTIHKVVIIEEIHKKTAECDCDGEHHTYINGVCCCGVRKMSQNYAGSGGRFVQQRSSWRSGGGYITFNSGGGQQRRNRIPTRDIPIFSGSPSNGGSIGGGSSNGGNSGGGGSNGGSSGGSGSGGGSNGGGAISGVNQRIGR